MAFFILAVVFGLILLFVLIFSLIGKVERIESKLGHLMKRPPRPVPSRCS